MISLVIDKNHGHGRFVFNGYCLAVTDKKHVAKKKDTLCLDRLLYRLLHLSDEVGLIVMLFVKNNVVQFRQI